MLAIAIVAFVLATVVGVLVWPHVFGSKPQHGNAGEGALSVADLRVRLAFEAGQRAGSPGRHHLITHDLVNV